MASLILEHICKKYGADFVIEDISLETRDNEFIVFLGPSGCGKTTLLRIIAGLERPSDGKVYLDGKEITDLDPRERDISMIFQNYPVYPHMNPYDNIALPLRLKGESKIAIRQIVARIADKLNIADLLYRKTETLSGGELQRVAIGKALVKKPGIFLMDEPLSDLDAQIKLSIKEIIRTIRQEEKGLFLYVTHDHSEANSLADRIAVMHDRKIIQFDTPTTIYDNPRTIFVAQFIGFPAINTFEAEIANDSDRLVLITRIGQMEITSLRDHLITYGKREVIIGIRPEYMTILDDPADSQNSMFSATVRYAEFIGNQYLVWIHEIPGFKALYRGKRLLAANERIYLTLQETAVLFFDRESGMRV